jgi:mono/diheme cytochrome c family protein
MKRVPGAIAPVLALLTMASLASCAGAPPANSGLHLYTVSCAGCHGMDARGTGAAAPVLRVPAPDLTLIAARRGGSFPEDEIYRIIDGQADLSAHGPRNMPVWGYEFYGADPDDELAHREATTKVESLVEFLQSIQRHP